MTRCTLAIVAVLTGGPAAAVAQTTYSVVGDAIPGSLTGQDGDPGRGRAIVASRQTGLCLLCHSGPFPEERFQGTLAPTLGASSMPRGSIPTRSCRHISGPRGWIASPAPSPASPS
jgi:sulfur-oxidizing protein SoxX